MSRVPLPLLALSALALSACALSHEPGGPTSGVVFGSGGSGAGPAPLDDGGPAPDAGYPDGRECMPSIPRYVDGLLDAPRMDFLVDSVDVDFPCGCDPDPDRTLARVRVHLRDGVSARVALLRPDCEDGTVAVPPEGATLACMRGHAASVWGIAAVGPELADRVVLIWTPGAAIGGTWCAPTHFDCHTVPDTAGETTRECVPMAG